MSRRLIREIINAAEEEELRQTLNRLGRIDFALRTVTITGTAFAIEFIANALLHLAQLPHVLYVIQQIILFGAFGTILLRGIDQRLMDAGLARWYRYPVIVVWLLSVSLPAAWPSGWRVGLGLFLLLLILGCSIRGEPLPMELVSLDRLAESQPSAYALKQQNRPRWFINPVSFLRSLLSLGCFWLPLIWLDNASGGGIGVWFARFGYCILSLLWFYVLIGRLDDAGRLPRKRYQLLLIGLVLLIGVFGRILGEGWSARPHGFLLSSATLFVYLLKAWLKYLNGYEILTLFLFIQIPLALLPSKPRPSGSASESDHAEIRLKRRVTNVRSSELALCEPFEFLRILSVIAFIWIPLIYMDSTSGDGIGSWIARIGYSILVFFWMTFAHGRFEDAGMAHSGYVPQYFLIVSVASMMPFAVHWVNGYGALVIFVLIQIPTVFMRSKPKPEEPIPDGIPSGH